MRGVGGGHASRARQARAAATYQQQQAQASPRHADTDIVDRRHASRLSHTPLSAHATARDSAVAAYYRLQHTPESHQRVSHREGRKHHKERLHGQHEVYLRDKSTTLSGLHEGEDTHWFRHTGHSHQRVTNHDYGSHR